MFATQLARERLTALIDQDTLAISCREMKVVARNAVSTAIRSELVDRLVASGRYRDVSDALRAGPGVART